MRKIPNKKYILKKKKKKKVKVRSQGGNGCTKSNEPQNREIPSHVFKSSMSQMTKEAILIPGIYQPLFLFCEILSLQSQTRFIKEMFF